MFTARLRRRGSSLVVTIPPGEVERLGLVAGQSVSVDIQPVPASGALAPDLRDAFQVEMAKSGEALRHLAG